MNRHASILGKIKDSLYQVLVSRSPDGFDGLHTIWENLTSIGATRSEIIEAAYKIDPDLGDAVINFNVDKMDHILAKLAIYDVIQVNKNYPWGELPTLEEYIDIWNEAHQSSEINVTPPKNVIDYIDPGVYSYGSIYNLLEQLLAQYNEDESDSVADALDYLIEVSGIEWV